MDNVITIQNLNKTFKVHKNRPASIRDWLAIGLKRRNYENDNRLKALVDLNFNVNKGDFLGILGRNGSGKSTLLHILMGTMRPDKGSIVRRSGKMIRLALGMGFDPNLSARHNIYMNGSILGLTFKRIGLIFDDIIEFAELEDFIEMPVKNYSSGMIARLKFAVALHAQADIFLMDEFFNGVGDIKFNQKSEEALKKTFLDGRTIIFVSHSLSQIQTYCNKVLVIDKGRQIGMGETNAMIDLYKNQFL